MRISTTRQRVDNVGNACGRMEEEERSDREQQRWEKDLKGRFLSPVGFD
jgi:hypothetical protein